MKKLFILLLVVLLGSNVFAQSKSVGDAGIDRLFSFNAKPEYIRLEALVGAQGINDFINGRSNREGDFTQSTYCFVVDQKFYILSYDTVITKTTIPNHKSITQEMEYKYALGKGYRISRDLHLFCWDGTQWHKVTETPIQTDYIDSYYYCNGGNTFPRTHIIHRYYPMHYHPSPEFGQSVNVDAKGWVTIKLAYHTNIDFIFTDSFHNTKVYLKTIILKPCSEIGRYTFEIILNRI